LKKLNRTWMGKKINFYWIIPVGLISGISGFLSSSFKYFDFNKEINLVNLFSIVVTTSFGVYIASTLRENIEAKKFEKELVHEPIRTLRYELKSLENNLYSNSLMFSEIVNSFKSISSLITEIEDFNNVCLVVNSEDIKKFRMTFNQLKPLVTDNPVYKMKFKLETHDMNSSKKIVKVFQSLLINTMVKINRN